MQALTSFQGVPVWLVHQSAAQKTQRFLQLSKVDSYALACLLFEVTILLWKVGIEPNVPLNKRHHRWMKHRDSINGWIGYLWVVWWGLELNLYMLLASNASQLESLFLWRFNGSYSCANNEFLLLPLAIVVTTRKEEEREKWQLCSRASTSGSNGQPLKQFLSSKPVGQWPWSIALFAICELGCFQKRFATTMEEVKLP